MSRRDGKPEVVLVCHEDDLIDRQGLSAWLANSLCLTGIVVLRERPVALLNRLRREYRRVGFLRMLDVILFRLFYRLCLAASDRAWVETTARELRRRYPVDTGSIPQIVSDNPNTKEVKEFLLNRKPDIVLARCKCLLKPDIFTIPRHGTFALHPGICPEYRNAHGCFWALARRDLVRVGMTLLKVDAGADTGTVYMQLPCVFDEVRESHIRIQYRAVVDNLDTIAWYLREIYAGKASALPTQGRVSRNWGQPWLSAYIYWKFSARRVTA